MISNAQEFELTPEGLKSNGMDYLVLDYPEKSQEELYNKTLAYLHTLYKNPKEALSTLDNESITITGFAKNRIRRNGGNVFDLDYTWVIRFKDGKVRFDSPSVTMKTWRDLDRITMVINKEKAYLLGGVFGIYKKGKLKSENAKADLEHYFNTILKDYSNSFLTDNDW